jgi:transcriptional regulator with XRE-family HTH domain
VSRLLLTVAMSPSVRRPTVERQVRRRHRAIVRKIGQDVLQLRTDAAATQGRVSIIAGIDRSHVARIEAGTANASIETLIALATALGAELSIRFYAGSGPRLTDRHQARMLEAILRRLSPVWRPHLEVPVFRPARGVVDAVFERPAERLLVVSEASSTIPRLEQQIRWAAEKAASIGSSDLVHPGVEPVVSKLLILRSTEATRSIARAFEAVLRTAYPARTRDAVGSLVDGTPWPGSSIVWVRIEGERVELLDGPPRGVSLGR